MPGDFPSPMAGTLTVFFVRSDLPFSNRLRSGGIAVNRTVSNVEKQNIAKHFTKMMRIVNICKHNIS